MAICKMVVLGHSSVHGQLSVHVTHTALWSPLLCGRHCWSGRHCSVVATALYVVATAGVVVKLMRIWLHKMAAFYSNSVKCWVQGVCVQNG